MLCACAFLGLFVWLGVGPERLSVSPHDTLSEEIARRASRRLLSMSGDAMIAMAPVIQGINSYRGTAIDNDKDYHKLVAKVRAPDRDRSLAPASPPLRPDPHRAIVSPARAVQEDCKGQKQERQENGQGRIGTTDLCERCLAA